MFKRLDDRSPKSDGPSLGKLLNTIDTPAPVLRTFIGNPLFTTPDALNVIKEDYLGQLDVTDLVFKGFEDIPLSKLYTQFPQVQQILSARQSGSKFDSNCDAGGMNVDSLSGRKQLTVQKYVDRVRIDQPKILIALADEVYSPKVALEDPFMICRSRCLQVNPTIGKKRLTKAIERTATWFQAFVTACKAAGIEFSSGAIEHAPFLFGVAQYNASYAPQLPLLVKHMLSQGARGEEQCCYCSSLPFRTFSLVFRYAFSDLLSYSVRPLYCHEQA
jgi:hypothetical protein